MKGGLLKFSDKSREELIEEILRLEKENEALKKKLKEQQEKEARKKELRFQRLLARAKRPKAPGQKAGHPGFTRVKPKTVDRVVEQTLKYCPDCHHRLSKSQEVIKHIQEDLIPAHPQVTLFKKHRYWCSDCRKLVTAPYAPEEIPHGNLGLSRVGLKPATPGRVKTSQG